MSGSGKGLNFSSEEDSSEESSASDWDSEEVSFFSLIELKQN